MKNYDFYIGLATFLIVDYVTSFLGFIILEFCIYLQISFYISSILISIISISIIYLIVFKKDVFKNSIKISIFIVLLYPIVNYIDWNLTTLSDIDYTIVMQLNNSINNFSLFIIALISIIIYYKNSKLNRDEKSVD